MPKHGVKFGIAGTCLVLAAVSGCASSPRENEAYASLLVGHQPVSVREALAAGPVDQVQPGQDYEFKLSIQSPVLEENGVRAGYRAITFSLPTSKSLDIETRSFCDCLGLKKYAVMPVLRLFDASGSEIRLSHGFPKWRDPDWHQSASITRRWTCLLYTSPSPRDRTRSRMPSSA